MLPGAWKGLLSFVLAEAGLELVPKEIWRRPAVAADARRRGKEPAEMLLDRSFHHSAMASLRDAEKRGRPDLVHATLLSVTGTPLYLDGRVKVWIHTSAGIAVEIAEKTRVPKSYIRFRGLMEEALAGVTEGGLVRARAMGMKELARGLRPGRVFGLSVLGRQGSAEGLAAEVAAMKAPAVVVGGFPRGHFSGTTMAVIDELVRIHPRPLEAHVVAARVVYEVEKAEARFKD
ncbi:MAG: ribosome biogenesis protein [Nitrososphaerota archaeon]|nr:ribosome biogenesis protein [Nitrososphaerota archaeon]MDG6924857.1 ribosome biogenesis protein [Nitrososphaerota archaeon]MDG6937590.1 ribosome biogenesis protein [Nitrososphaerota archaeon]MDG6952455.1 ribosome biogenesis protein [Nitrososphaerota archaeon]MDG6955577.1 ribosome biogenesis protein [Nitrososphaerota archaeon]